jgi:hypothetical protein
MFDREYELYDVFGKHPTIQLSMRYTSKELMKRHNFHY